MTTKKKKHFTVKYSVDTSKVFKEADSFLLYSRDGDIQGVVTNLLHTGETIIHLTDDHNHRISLETLEKWVKQARKYDKGTHKIWAALVRPNKTSKASKVSKTKKPSKTSKKSR